MMLTTVAISTTATTTQKWRNHLQHDIIRGRSEYDSHCHVDVQGFVNKRGSLFVQRAPERVLV